MLADITRAALERHGIDGITSAKQLYTNAEQRQLADQLAATISTGELLGRARIRERADDGLHSHQPTTFRKFDETTAGGPIAPMAPRAAVEYFRRLLPTLEIDADGFERQTNADALTLAVTTDQTVLERVHAAILERLETGSQRALLGRVGDRTVWFVPHPKAPPGSPTILADVADLDAAWQADAEQYIPPGGGGETEIGGRRADFENFLATGEDVQAPLVVLNRDGSVSIEDGRHRLSVLRDMGIDQVAVTVPGSQAEQAAALFGSSLAAEASALTGAEAIAKILDDAGVSSDNPQYCFLPGTVVEGDVLAASKAWYDGPAVEIETDDGRRLAVTVNHPVLTPAGWQRAGDVREGDNLVCYGGPVEPLSAGGVSSGRGQLAGCAVTDCGPAVRALTSVLAEPERRAINNNQAPPRIEDVFQAISIQRSARLHVQRPVGPLDFYGDAAFFPGEVHCVWADWKLMGGPDAESGQFANQVNLVPGFVPSARSPGVACGLFHFACDRPAHAPLAFDKRLEDGGFSFGRDSRPEPTHPVPAVSQLDPAIFKATTKRAGGDVKLARDLVQRFPGVVAAHRVVRVKRIHWAGHVYDLQTATGFIVSQGIVTSNCEMVFRTNAIESYNAGAQQELDEVKESYPVWLYSNPNDGRSRESHAAKDGLYFSSDRPFADVRGTADSDVCNCRCTFIPVHRLEWSELAKAGAKVEK